MHLRYAAAGILLTLTLACIFGCTSTETANVPPIADFSPSPSTGSAPLDVSFDASTSTDTDGDIAGYEWEFGDAATGTGETIDHRYEKSGIYSVKLTVTDDEGATHSVTKNVGVTNSAPTAVFTTTSGQVQREITLDASGSSDVDGEIVSYRWDFGDGTTGTGKAAVHCYSHSGEYLINLTVTDNKGVTSSVSQNITITSAQQTPEQQGPLKVLDWKLLASNNIAISWVVIGHARNISSRKLDYTEVQAQFRDSSNVAMRSWFDNTANLEPGDTWEFHIFMLGAQNANRVDNATISLGPWW